MLPLTPAAQAAVERIRQRDRNQQGRAALEHLRRAQLHRRRVHAAREAAEHAARTGSGGAPRPPAIAAALDHIHQHPGSTTRQIADATRTPPSTMSSRLDRLWKNAEITRTLTRGPGGRGTQAHWWPPDQAGA